MRLYLIFYNFAENFTLEIRQCHVNAVCCDNIRAFKLQ